MCGLPGVNGLYWRIFRSNYAKFSEEAAREGIRIPRVWPSSWCGPSMLEIHDQALVKSIQVVPSRQRWMDV